MGGKTPLAAWDDIQANHDMRVQLAGCALWNLDIIFYLKKKERKKVVTVYMSLYFIYFYFDFICIYIYIYMLVLVALIYLYTVSPMSS